MNKLKDFIAETLYPYEGYMEWREPTMADLEKLIELATDAKEELQNSPDNKNTLRGLLYDLRCLIENPHIDWQSKFDGCWLIEAKMKQLTTIEWDDPDTGGLEDVMAFYEAAKNHIENL